jgi:hypothetical protein
MKKTVHFSLAWKQENVKKNVLSENKNDLANQLYPSEKKRQGTHQINLLFIRKKKKYLLF